LKLLPEKSRFAVPVARVLVAAMFAGGLMTASAAMAGKGDCGQPQSTGANPSASDCAYILKTSVQILSCDVCICDVNNSTTITASDALLCLRKAVAQPVVLNCPSCGPTTTVATGSTTSTSTTSTTTTLAVNCSSNSDCAALPAGHRCNPNNDLCEKPCTRNADCHDFYTQCNKVTGYCQEPALLF